MSISRPPGILLALYLLLGVLYSTTTPLFETPDEQWHFAFVQYVAQGHGLPVQAQPLRHLAKQEGSQPPLYYLLAAGLTFWIDTSDYPAIAWENPHYGYDVPGVVNDNKNLFVHTAQESFPYHNTSLAMHVARWFSLLMGAVAVYFTYRIALLMSVRRPIELNSTAEQPGRKNIAGLSNEANSGAVQDGRENIAKNPTEWVAWAAAALVAFNPQFLYISSAVSNDSLIVALSAVALFLLVRAFQMPLTNRGAIVLGVVCGLCALAKVSGIAMLPLAVLVVAVARPSGSPESSGASARPLRSPQTSKVLVCEILLCGSWLLVAGWWYVRNILLYGELTGTGRMVEIFGGRTAPFTLDAWSAQLYEAFETFWLGFGWGNVRAPEWLYLILGVGVMLAIVGLILGVWRARHTLSTALGTQLPLFVLAAWIGVIFLALVQWMIQVDAPYGRLLFPALPAIAPLLVIGWGQLLSERGKGIFYRVVPIALVALAALAPFLFILPAYALPDTLNESDVSVIPARVDIRYGDKLMLLGSRITPHPVDPRGAMQVDLYWRVLTKMDVDYSLNLSALDDKFRVVGSRNSYPGHGTLPTTLMRAGQIFHDTYWLPARTPKGAVQVSVFDRATEQDLSAFDPAGNEITPIVNQYQLAQ